MASVSERLNWPSCRSLWDMRNCTPKLWTRSSINLFVFSPDTNLTRALASFWLHLSKQSRFLLKKADHIPQKHLSFSSIVSVLEPPELLPLFRDQYYPRQALHPTVISLMFGCLCFQSRRCVYAEWCACSGISQLHHMVGMRLGSFLPRSLSLLWAERGEWGIDEASQLTDGCISVILNHSSAAIDAPLDDAHLLEL